MGNLLTEHASNTVAEAAAGSADAKTIVFDEADLVRRAQSGQAEAYGELVRQYQNRIYNLTYRMCGRAEDAEELAQEVFLKAFEKIHQFRHRSRFYTWLFRIAKNVTISHCRRNRRVKFISLSGTDENADCAIAQDQMAEQAARRNPGPEQAATRKETARKVTDALNELDEEFRIVVVLRDIEDMNYGGIAEVLDLPTGTVKSRLHRARNMLREKLADLVG